MLALALPFWFVAAWTFRMATLLRRGTELRRAAIGSAWFMVLLLPAAPLVMIAAGLLWVPAVAACATALFIKRPGRMESATSAEM